MAGGAQSSPVLADNDTDDYKDELEKYILQIHFTDSNKNTYAFIYYVPIFQNDSENKGYQRIVVAKKYLI